MQIVAVGIGGFLGAILRYGVGQWVQAEDGFPIGTLGVNLLGCLVLAWFYTMAANRWKVHPHVKLGLGTGLIGAFTTFSTFSVETLTMITQHQLPYAALYVLVSVIGGVGLAFTGARLAQLRT